MRENHRVDRLGVTLDEMPQILADVFAVNKVFRRSFWSRAGLAFPEGVRYEDQPTLTEAYLKSTAFDVITHTVYLWRIRADHSSITQQRHEIADLRDRITTKRAAQSLLRDAAPHIRTTWLTDVLPVDMWEYFRAVPRATDEYWRMLRDAVQEFWTADTITYEHARVPVQQRLMGWLVAHDRRAELLELLLFLDERRPGGLPVEVRDGAEVCLLPGHEGAGTTVPLALYTVGPRDDRGRLVDVVRELSSAAAVAG
jgi:CDP-glycerol glycerophosphotransferase